MSILHHSQRKSKNTPPPPPPGLRLRRARRLRCECRCANRPRLSIDFTILIGWVFGFWTAISDIINAARRVTRVKPFVTGFWEVFQTKEYCLGPTINPMPSYLGSEQVYVVVTEDSVLLKFSLWPGLETDGGSDGSEEEEGGEEGGEGGDKSTSYEYNIYGTPCAPSAFTGQMRKAQARGVHRATYVLLMLSRAACFLLVRAAARVVVIPRATQASVVLESRYDIFPVPTAEQADQTQTTFDEQAYASNTYKPLRPDLIRGPEALEAARRAGFKFEI